MAKKRNKAFYNPDDGTFEKPLTGKVEGYGDYFITGYNKQDFEKRKNEKITANFMNGTSQSMDFYNNVFFNPELTPDMWLMPKSRLETLRWVRIYYNMDPYIHQIINMHANYPFSKFTLSCEDEEVTRIMNNISFNRNFNALDYILKASLSYNKFGEAINYGIDDKLTKRIKDKEVSVRYWKRLVLMEPEYVEVRQEWWEEQPRYYLQITDSMRSGIKEAHKAGRNISNVEKYNTLNEELVEDYKMFSILNSTDASATRGTSPLQSLLKTLMYQSKVDMLRLTAIDRFRWPIEIWKVGNLEHKIKFNDDQMNEFKNYVKQAKNNPPFSLFVPPFVDYEVKGYGNEKTIFDYASDYEYTRDAILAGLGVNKALVLGEGPSMSNVKDVTYMKLFMMYKNIQDKFTEAFKNNFYHPMCEWNKWTKQNQDYDIPEMTYLRQINLDRDETEDYKGLWDDGLITTKTLFSKYKGLDYQKESVGLTEEYNTVFDDGKRIRNRNIEPQVKKEEVPPPPAESDIPEIDNSQTPPEEKPAPPEVKEEEIVVEETPKEDTLE